jgi:hypothetical protein
LGLLNFVNDQYDIVYLIILAADMFRVMFLTL